MRVVGLCAAALLVAPPALAAQPASPEELAAALARPGVVAVTVDWHGWVRDKLTGEVFGGTAGYEVRTHCTGVVVAPDGYVATASRCVHTGPAGGAGLLFDAAVADLAKVGRIGDPAKARQAFADRAVAEGANPGRPVDRRIAVERSERDGGERRTDSAPATVVDLVAPDDGDVAVLRIPRQNLPSIELRPDAPPVGTPVLAIGYPVSDTDPVDPGLEPSSRDGRVSGHRTRGTRPFYEVSATADNGMTGGPVVDSQGRLVGILSSLGDTRFASATTTLAELLRGKGITAEPGPLDRDYRAALDRYYANDFDGAVEYLDAVLAATPSHEQAIAYRELAIGKGGDPDPLPDRLVRCSAFLGAAAVLVLLVAIALLVRDRKRRVSTMDTPPLGIPLLPAGLGAEPQPDREGDTDQAERREAVQDEDAHQHADDDTARVEPRTPDPGGPGAADPDQRDDADQAAEHERLQ
ncbi:S1 family peptidase [Umezawaea tangerina]|uniref:Trypsin-like peptidase n=1 Tax=Umezawaea tangerina TaxID=84725 RepID=A0A2T0T575_9PSEU|nr:serine protease [Umezawaea tangerina]PRY40789.1 trypsin-like peptidase [Umezawaea tangerina]